MRLLHINQISYLEYYQLWFIVSQFQDICAFIPSVLPAWIESMWLDDFIEKINFKND